MSELDIPKEVLKKSLGLVERAVIFAVEAHAGSMRKGSHTPYIVHPMETAAIAASMTEEPEVLAAAVLHDVIEDAGITYEQIRELFGLRVAELVDSLTENKREGVPPEETWEIRKRETLEHLRTTADRDVKIIALGDRLSNIRSMYRDYQQIGDELWERFHQKDKKRQRWAYESALEALKELQELPAYQEYQALVKEVFGK